jgi:hypothetical protein
MSFNDVQSVDRLFVNKSVKRAKPEEVLDDDDRLGSPIQLLSPVVVG